MKQAIITWTMLEVDFWKTDIFIHNMCQKWEESLATFIDYFCFVAENTLFETR